MHVSSGPSTRISILRIGWKQQCLISSALVTSLALLLNAGSSFGASHHRISVAPDSIDFGKQSVTAIEHRTVTIQNTANHTINVSDVWLRGSHAFVLTGWSEEITLQPTESLQLDVSFDPSKVNNYSATLVIAYDGGRSLFTHVQGTGVEAKAAHLSLSPKTAVVHAGESQQFTASLVGATHGKRGSSETTIEWRVNGTPGGDPVAGTISPNGLYTAPPDVSADSSVVVTASDGASKASARMTIKHAPAQPAVSVSISPGSASVQAGQSRQFTARVSGATNTSVNWLVAGVVGGNSTVGTISGAGLYTAPSRIPAGPVTVTAQSAIAATRSANATVTIVTAPAPVSVTISPGSTILQVGKSRQFTATVSGTADIGVKWLVAGVVAGNSILGTISGAGLYTAPSSVPAGPVTVTAQSTFAPTSSANATVTILAAPTPVTVSISPTSATVLAGQSQQFTASVLGTTNTGVSWLVAGVAGGNSSVGTISATGIYIAPSTVPTGPVTVTAQSTFASTSSANATVAITAASHFVDLSWTASSPAVAAGYNIYRGTVSGGPYTRINSSLEAATAYSDNTVQSGQTYYYATTAVDSTGVESDFSNEVSTLIP